MRAVILTGGEGTRLRPYTTVVPKPLVPIGRRPILERVIRQLAANGFNRIDLLAGYLGHLIKAYLDQIELPDGLDIRYRWEEKPLGTAGALRQIDDLDEPFLAMNGDILTTINYAELMRFHADQDALLTVAMHRQAIPLEIGVVRSEHHSVVGYDEKPTIHYDVSMGIYAYDPAAIEHIPDGHFDFPDLVRALLAAGKPVSAYPSVARWFDVGTATEHERATAEFEAHPELFGDD